MAAADCTSSKLAPFSNAVVINVARIEWAEYPRLQSNVSCILAQRAVNHVRCRGRRASRPLRWSRTGRKHILLNLVVKSQTVDIAEVILSHA